MDDNSFQNYILSLNVEQEIMVDFYMSVSYILKAHQTSLYIKSDNLIVEFGSTNYVRHLKKPLI